MKLRSSPTLLEATNPAPVFAVELTRQLVGERDAATLEILGR